MGGRICEERNNKDISTEKRLQQFVYTDTTKKKRTQRIKNDEPQISSVYFSYFSVKTSLQHPPSPLCYESKRTVEDVLLLWTQPHVLVFHESYS